MDCLLTVLGKRCWWPIAERTVGPNLFGNPLPGVSRTGPSGPPRRNRRDYGTQLPRRRRSGETTSAGEYEPLTEQQTMGQPATAMNTIADDHWAYTGPPAKVVLLVACMGYICERRSPAHLRHACFEPTP